jgi:lipoic acid synthetase
LELLRRVREYTPVIVTKSGIMVGVGETREEIIRVVADLVKAGSLILTIGQYLQPTRTHYPVHRFLPPQEFQRLREEALAEGMAKVFSGPLVRSSYLADEIFRELGWRSRLSPHEGRTLDGGSGPLY